MYLYLFEVKEIILLLNVWIQLWLSVSPALHAATDTNFSLVSVMIAQIP